jgi:hypothetical protein
LRKINFVGFCILMALATSSAIVAADPITGVNGTLTVNNDNGNFNANISSILTVVFSLPSSGRGGGGGGGFDKTNYSRNTTPSAPIDNLAELLSTISPKELGYESLPADKMKAERLNTFLTTSRLLDSSGLAPWLDLSPDQAAKDYINSLISGMNSGKLGAAGLDHKVETFRITTVYSNSQASAARTRVTITIKALYDIYDLRIIELIPKSVVSSSSALIFVDKKPKMISPDPLLEWSIPSFKKGESRSFTYYIRDAVASDDFRTIAVFDALKTQVPVAAPTGDVVAEQPASEEQGGDYSPVSGGYDDSSKVGSKMLVPLLFLLAIGGLVLVGSVIIKKRDARKELAASSAASGGAGRVLMIRKDLIVPYFKVEEAERLIESRVRKGMSDPEIKEELISIGWDDHAVDVIVHDVHTVDDNIDKLDGFVQACLDKGLSLKNIKDTLMNVGWREDVVDLVLEDFR